MVLAHGGARSTQSRDVTITFSVTPTSVVIAYAIGVLLTLAVVAFSAWRVSRMNIVTAIRNLPEPPAAGTRRARWLLGRGRASCSARCWSSRASAVEGRDHPRLRRLAAWSSASSRSRGRSGAPERLVYTSAGLVLVAWFVLPMSRWLFGDLQDELLDLHPRRARDRRRRELGDHVQRRRPARAA